MAELIVNVLEGGERGECRVDMLRLSDSKINCGIDRLAALIMI